MVRTTLVTVLLMLLGWWSGAWVTRDFQVWTAEGARRLAVVERPVETPLATLAGPGAVGIDLRAWLSGPGRATIVDFVYTRCPTVCLTLGSGFQQLQQALAKTPDSGVKLLSISFDPLHDDGPSLQRYAGRFRADPAHWTIATVHDTVQLQRLLSAFQVVVIDDGRGGFEHNAALLVIDGRGRLVRIFDDTDIDLALNYAQAPLGGAGSKMTAMHRAGSRGSRWGSALGALLLLLMLMPPVRKMTESSMTAHMLIQYPCLLLAGALLVRELPARWLSVTERWNELGISGFVGSALALALLMIPRVLDLALVDGGVEAMKMLALVATGAALSLSWQCAGLVMQAFFLGNVLWMTAAVGMLYQDAVVRVCNAYRLDDQQDLGVALVLIAIAGGVMWLLHTASARARLERSVLPVPPDTTDLETQPPHGHL